MKSAGDKPELVSRTKTRADVVDDGAEGKTSKKPAVKNKKAAKGDK